MLFKYRYLLHFIEQVNQNEIDIEVKKRTLSKTVFQPNAGEEGASLLHCISSWRKLCGKTVHGGWFSLRPTIPLPSDNRLVPTLVLGLCAIDVQAAFLTSFWFKFKLIIRWCRNRVQNWSILKSSKVYLSISSINGMVLQLLYYQSCSAVFCSVFFITNV